MKQSTKNTEKKRFSFSQIWKEKRFRSIFISALVILFCAILYLVLLFTVLSPEKEEELPTVGNHGEEMESGRPFVVDPVDADNMLSIKVENDLGSYRYYKGADGQYYFEGAEMMYYDQSSDWMNQSTEDLSDIMQNVSMVDSLVNLVRYMLATEEVVGYDKDNLAAYGLEGRGKAAATLTYLDKVGKEREDTVFFGNKTVSGDGYYVMVDGREALYILSDTYITRCMFADVKDYLLPQVAPSVSSAGYMEVEEVTIRKKGQKFVSIEKLSEEEYKETGELFTHAFSFPAGYYPSAEQLQVILQSFVNFTGEEVSDFNISSRLSDRTNAAEMRKLFQLYSLVDGNNNWNYELYYKYANFDITLYISEKLEVTSGTEGEEKEYIYYIYSPDFDLIAEFKAEDLSWVEWDLLNLLDNHSFSVSIDQVATMELYYNDTNAKFSLQGESDGLKVTSSNGVKVDTDNFRQLYKAVLYTTMDGYADKPEESDEILRVCVTLRDGKVYDYSFFGLTARKAYYTLNGSGEFYINRDYVKQIISACDGILKGEKVTVDRKN